MKILFISPELSKQHNKDAFSSELSGVNGYKNLEVMGGHCLNVIRFNFNTVKKSG